MNDWFEIDEQSEVDVEQIMDHIRAYIAEKRIEEDLDAALGADFHFQGNLSGDIYDAFAAAVRATRGSGLALDMRSSRIPVIGPVVNAARRMLHQVVVFYVNKSMAVNISTNSAVIKALAALVTEVERQKMAVAELETDCAELPDLRTRVVNLENQ